jgi:CspA family cold shock protein
MDGQEPAYCPGCRHLLALTRRWGVVKWFDARKGFGFITMTDGTDVFVRRRDIRGRKNLRKGQLVQFRLKEGRNGARATSVRIQNRPAPE